MDKSVMSGKEEGNVAPQKISAVINTYNAAEGLRQVLPYLKVFDEVVVCDMESTDDTVAVALQAGCRVITFPKGDITICEPARNTAIQAARNEWVLVVDADEIITPALANYLHEYVNRPDCADALFIARRNLIFQTHDSSAYPDYQCRLVRKSCCDWPPVIHVNPVINGRVDFIDRKRKDLAMIHMPMPVDAYFRKICTYTDNEVPRRLARNPKTISLARFIYDPAFRFFKRYILKGGILRGKIGYIEARLDYVYRFMVLCKMYDRQLALKNTPKK